MPILDRKIFNERDEMMAAMLLSLRQRSPEAAKQVDDFLMDPTTKKVGRIGLNLNVHPDKMPDKYAGYFVALQDFLSYSEPMKKKLLADIIIGPMHQSINVEFLKLAEDDRQQFLNEEKKKEAASAGNDKEQEEIRIKASAEAAKAIAEREVKGKLRAELQGILKQAEDLLQYLTKFISLSPREMKKAREVYIRNNDIFRKLMDRSVSVENRIGESNDAANKLNDVSEKFELLVEKAEKLLMQKELAYGKDGEEKMLNLFQRYREQLLEMRKDLKKGLKMWQSNEFDDSRLNFIVSDVNGLKRNVLSKKKENMTDEFREKFFILVDEIENDKVQISDLLAQVKENIAKQQDVKAQQDVKVQQEYEALRRLRSLALWWQVTCWEKPKTPNHMGSFVSPFQF